MVIAYCYCNPTGVARCKVAGCKLNAGELNLQFETYNLQCFKETLTLSPLTGLRAQLQKTQMRRPYRGGRVTLTLRGAFVMFNKKNIHNNQWCIQSNYLWQY